MTDKQLLTELLKRINGEEIADHFDRDLLLKVENSITVDESERCSHGCPGWAHFNLGADRESIERCDECDRFADDEEATAAHDLLCRCGAGADSRILRCHWCGGPMHRRQAIIIGWGSGPRHGEIHELAGHPNCCPATYEVQS